MAELLIKAKDAFNADPVKDQRGCYKRGMIVEIRPDNTVYGSAETLPTFVKVKIPLIAVDHPTLVKLMNQQQVQNGFEMDGTTPRYNTVRRRRCWLKVADIPVAARNKLLTTGELIIKASPSYEGPYDYTWTQVRNYFWDDDIQSAMTGDNI